MKHRALLFTLLPLLAITATHADEAVHERIEWSDVWVTNANTDAGTKVLLVGDSIVRGYFAAVEKDLGTEYSCARYTTSKFLGHPDFLGELGLLVRRFHFDIIHVNNGLHGWDYTEEQYRDGLEALVTFFQDVTPRSRLVWAMTTPVREGNNIEVVKEERTNRVIARNALASEVMKAHGIPVNDLFTLVRDHTDYFAQDGTHFSDKGKAAQAKQVADVLRTALTH